VSRGRPLVAAAVAAVVFAAVLCATFPTDAIVARMLAGVTPPAGTTLAVGGSALRPSGIRVDGVVLRGADGVTLATAERLVLRPSLAGLLRDGSGRPWHARGVACGGTVDAELARDDVLTLAWDDVDLAACPLFSVAGNRVVGRADAAATLREGATRGEGTVSLHDAVWDGAGRLVPGLDALHADRAAVRWTLAPAELALTTIDVAAREVRLQGSGTVALAAPFALSAGLTLAPGTAASGLLRALLAMLPAAADDPDVRRLAVAGTILAPRIVPPS
jgi:type II secretion system protein N